MPDDREKDPEHPFPWIPSISAQEMSDSEEHESTGAETGSENIMPDPPAHKVHPPLPKAPPARE